MHVEVAIRCDTPFFSAEAVKDLALFVLESEGAPSNSELSISLVSLEEIAELNSMYRSKEGPTDVLSFECDDPWEEHETSEHGAWDAMRDEIVLIGDVVIAPQVARDQAGVYGNTFEDEMTLLIVHGVLHLLGYDHMDEDEALEMETRERELITSSRRDYRDLRK